MNGWLSVFGLTWMHGLLLNSRSSGETSSFRSITLVTFTCQSTGWHRRTCRTRPHSISVRKYSFESERDLFLSLSTSIVKVRETRLTVLLSHILIGTSLFMRNVLRQIPMPVLDGLFLYLALTSLDGNQFFERVTLFFTEQVSCFAVGKPSYLTFLFPGRLSSEPLHSSSSST